ncbi:hypothetical protein LV78_005460 [Actinosynnema pretiosum]|nr:hypothetical protein [Actinosynnema pretiosum]
MPELSADRRPPAPRTCRPAPSRRALILRGVVGALVLVTVCTAVAAVAITGLNAVAYVGQVVQRDVGTAVDNGIHRLLTPYCAPPADR